MTRIRSIRFRLREGSPVGQWPDFKDDGNFGEAHHLFGPILAKSELRPESILNRPYVSFQFLLLAFEGLSWIDSCHFPKLFMVAVLPLLLT